MQLHLLPRLPLHLLHRLPLFLLPLHLLLRSLHLLLPRLPLHQHQRLRQLHPQLRRQLPRRQLLMVQVQLTLAFPLLLRHQQCCSRRLMPRRYPLHFLQLPTPAVIPPAVASTSATPAPNGASTPAQPKRKPAATLIFDSFTKSKIEAAGIDLLDPFNLNAKLAANPPTQPKQRNTARTLIFKAGNPVDEMESLLSPSPNPATTTGSNPTVSANPSVGPNLAAAIAAYQAAGGGPAPAAAPVSTDAAARANSNVIPAHPAGGARPIARTMILKSLAKPEPNEVTEPLAAPQDGRPSAETIIAAGHAAEAAEAAEAQAAEAGRPQDCKTINSSDFDFQSVYAS